MRTLKLVAAALAAGFVANVVAIAASRAADNAPTYRRAAPVPYAAPAYNWSGFYIGVQGGGAFGGELTDRFTAGGTTFTDRYNMKGWSAGGTVGYNWQFHQNWLIGIESDYSWSNINGSRRDEWCTVATCGSLGVDDFKERLNHFGTTRLRGGFVWNDLLLYGTGGVAYGSFESIATTTSPWFNSTMKESGYGLGWTVGAGAEWAINNSWSLKAEYLYIDLNAGKSSSASPLFNTTGRRDFSTHLVRGGINFKF